MRPQHIICSYVLYCGLYLYHQYISNIHTMGGQLWVPMNLPVCHKYNAYICNLYEILLFLRLVNHLVCYFLHINCFTRVFKYWKSNWVTKLLGFKSNHIQWHTLKYNIEIVPGCPCVFSWNVWEPHAPACPLWRASSVWQLVCYFLAMYKDNNKS